MSRSTITPATGGEIHATADVPFGAQPPWWIKADWRGLDAASAFRLADVSPLPFGAALDGQRAPRSRAGRAVPSGSCTTSQLRALAQGTAPLEGEVEFFIDGHRWRANQRHRMGATCVEGRIGGVWNRQAATRSTFEGELRWCDRQRRRGRALCGALRSGDARPRSRRDRPDGCRPSEDGRHLLPSRDLSAARGATASTCRRSARRHSTADFDVSAQRAQRHRHRRDRRRLRPARQAGDVRGESSDTRRRG